MEFETDQSVLDKLLEERSTLNERMQLLKTALDGKEETAAGPRGELQVQLEQVERLIANHEQQPPNHNDEGRG